MAQHLIHPHASPDLNTATVHTSGVAVGGNIGDTGKTQEDGPRVTEDRRDRRSVDRMLLTGSLVAAIATILFTIDALIRHRSEFDYRAIRAIQELDLPILEPVIHFVDTLTSSLWAITLWALLLIFFAVIRRSWLPALTVAVVPVAGAINWIIGQIVERPRPEAAQLIRAIDEIEATAFPSGHVVGAIVFYGVLFLLAGRIRTSAVRLSIRAGAVAIIVLTGFGRIWLGAHWVSDVVTAYALGLSLLLALAWVYRRIDAVAGDLPFVHAVPVPHDESISSAHALTSTILFQDDVVTKIYAPGFLPRAIYWLSFQAEFPYIRNRDALDAAVLRRNLAGKLTEYWYGGNRVARALGIVEFNGRLGIASERIEVVGQQDSDAEKQFLFDLCNRFDEAGLPTWQIDPRQPRGKDNALRGPDGNYYIVDLESGLASPMASPRAWLRAIRRADVPLFDTVYFDITHDYIERESEAMQAKMGEEWLQDLLELVDQAAAANARWHAGEPRIWSRMLRSVETGFGLGRIPGRIREATGSGRDRAESLLEGMVAEWESEERISSDEAVEMRRTLADPQIHRVIPHFGVHLAIGIATRFPVGSILRGSYTAINLLIVSLRFLSRRIDRAEWRLLSSIHSPLVVVVASMPGIGTFSYLLSGPIRSNHLLMRIVADAVLLKVPWHLYERFGWRSLIARPAGGVGERDDAATGWLKASHTRRIALGLAVVGVALIAVNFVLLAMNRAFAPSADWWTDMLELFTVDSGGSLPTDFTLALLGVAAVVVVSAGLVYWVRQGLSLLPWGMLALLALIFTLEEHLPAPASIATSIAEFDRTEAAIASWLWVVSLIAFLAIATFIGYSFAVALPAQYRGMVLIGVVLFLGGAFGLEIVGWLYRLFFDPTDFRYQLVTTAEELAEFLGVAVLLYVTLELARLQIGSAAGEEEAP